MRGLITASLVAVALAGVAKAADKPAVGPVPAWVKPVPLPPASAGTSDAPISVVLADHQVYFRPGHQTVYLETALKILTPQGLSAGNLSFQWHRCPDHSQAADTAR